VFVICVLICYQSCIFIFVTRAYDVGDRVYFKDELGAENNFVVQRINMLTTVFKRWDEQYTILPNQLLAKREIRNQRRSGNAVVVMPLFVALNTPKVHVLEMLLYVTLFHLYA
jgi:small-conductance mechanosensitive channel